MKSGSTSIADFMPDGDVFIVKFKNDADLDGDGIKELLSALENAAEGKKYKALADTRRLLLGHVSRSAYHVNVKEENAPHRLAEAFVVTDLPIRLLINFYHKTVKPTTPSKAFKTMEEAMEWLNTFK